MISRVTLVVLDGVGVGELPDAADYGDTGANTLAHVATAVGGLQLPNLEALGLGHIGEFAGIRRMGHPDGCFGKMGELSRGKDSTTGHWEMSGFVLETPFPTYPSGFPREVIEPFQQIIGRLVLGNRPASGTAVIQEFGEEHLKTGALIVYTSADSVFQIAAHEQVIPVEELYRICREARKLLRPPHQVARVIARPFIGEPGAFVRTARRRDFSVEPPGQTLLDVLKASGQPVVGIGKIDDLFNGRGLTRAIHTGNNATGIDETTRMLTMIPRGLIFTNLVDFDMGYGHRKDTPGYAMALEEFDARLPELLGAMRQDDLLCLTSDHGNDPTTPGTDHSREYVPLLVYGPRLARGVKLGTRQTFADLGQTIADALGAKRLAWGQSFLHALMAG
ncbi:MAG: phosphopentomutase [Nitrospirae bacterium]|nr:phosphopentomutase [Nitrospirota bacterium]